MKIVIYLLNSVSLVRLQMLFLSIETQKTEAAHL
jgi:hypothetical protein